MNRSTSSAASLAVFGALLATACGGSSSSDSALVGLAPPSTLSLVEPLDEDSPGGSFVAPGASSYPVDSAYVTDLQDVHVFDPSLDSLGTINMILCAVGATAASDMVNEEPYVAQFDFEGCQSGGADSSASDPSSSGGAESFVLWTVKSERTSNSADQKTFIWVPESDDTPRISVDMTITKGASAANPFGEWSMVYAGMGGSQTVLNAAMTGSLATFPSTASGAGFNFYEVQGDVTVAPASGDDARESLVSVALSSDLSTGEARVVNRHRDNFSGDSGLIQDEYVIAFDETHFLRETITAGSGDGGKAFHRDQVTENVWRYGLYYADGVNVGKAVEISSGFGIKNDDDEYGYIGYHGVWAPDGTDFSNNTTVTSQTYDADPVAYTVFRAPGKLVKNSRAELTISGLAGMIFEWPSENGSGDPMLYQVVYNSGTGLWTKIGEHDYSTTDFADVDPAVVIDTATLQVLNMWSRELGGNASYVHGDAFISYFTSETVIGNTDFFGANQTLELFGFVQCLESDITTSDANDGDVYLADASGVGAPYRFVFDRDTMALQYDSDGVGTMLEVGLATGQTISTGPNTWGMRSGPLVASISGMNNIHDIWGASEYYVYETGPNDWNVYTGVKDVNDVLVEFDAPLTIRYRHDEDNDRNGLNTYDGRTYLLEYQGDGQLNGIPHVGVDLDADSNADRYYPAFGMKDGTLVGVNDEYVLKAIDVEQQLLEDVGYSGSLTLTGAATMTVPDPSTWTAPTNGAVPVVTDPPRVIDGQVL